METANYNTCEIEYGGYASTNPGHHNDSYRMVEYLDTIIGTVQIRSPRDIQQRPGVPVYQRGIHLGAEAVERQNQHGR